MRCSAGARGRPTRALVARASRSMAALRANGCRDEAVAERRPPRGSDGTRSLLDPDFPGGGISRRGFDRWARRAGLRRDKTRPRAPPGRHSRQLGERRYGRIRWYSAPPGSYRTLCVRTCDGYYFPMSNASSPSDFERDQSNCQSELPRKRGADLLPPRWSGFGCSCSPASPASPTPICPRPGTQQTGTPSPAGCICGVPRNAGPQNFSIIAGNPPAPAGSARTRHALSTARSRRPRPGSANSQSRRRAGRQVTQAHGGGAEDQ